jgi:hypothetical protein
MFWVTVTSVQSFLCLSNRLFYNYAGNLERIAKGAEKSEFNSRKGQNIFLSSTASIRDLSPTQPVIQQVPGIPSPEVKRFVISRYKILFGVRTYYSNYPA